MAPHKGMRALALAALAGASLVAAGTAAEAGTATRAGGVTAEGYASCPKNHFCTWPKRNFQGKRTAIYLSRRVNACEPGADEFPAVVKNARSVRNMTKYNLWGHDKSWRTAVKIAPRRGKADNTKYKKTTRWCLG
ncbi:peptidase inhibitor family I36 protein [Actinomadura kijaniata]|uniref:peptidase inhibitor family I36 protein n=1 Tax=Actinomadura kijaniata TaxID=46161 RepID=UPI003F1E0746